MKNVIFETIGKSDFAKLDRKQDIIEANAILINEILINAIGNFVAIQKGILKTNETVLGETLEEIAEKQASELRKVYDLLNRL